MPFPLPTGFEVTQPGSLTGAGQQGTPVRCKGDPQTLQLTVSGIGTSLTARLEGSLDGTNWFPMKDETNSDFVFTANGTQGYTVYGPVLWARLVLVTFVGGTPTLSGLLGAV